MSKEYIDGNQLYNYIISGAHRLIAAEHSLNEINVFPVADGDTGTNLAFTMRTIIQKAKQDAAVHKTLMSISGVAMENAYGNSGIIFAQYFHGLSVEAKNREFITVKEFAEMTRNAVHFAYEAVANPVEGTILTVMKGWSEELLSGPNWDEVESLFERSLNRTKELVEQTRYGLKVLKKNNVVDAGAKGFMVFVEGILDFVRTGEIKKEKAFLKSYAAEQHDNHITAEVVKKNIYCSQYYVKTKTGMQEMKENLAAFGDSIVVGSDGEYLSIHLHTDRPDLVMQHLNQLGEVATHRMEDMRLQSLMMNHKDRRIAIITDSIADIPQTFLWDHKITMIPLNLICDSVAYLDKVSMTPPIFYDAWDNFEIYPTSSQPSIDSIEKALRGLAGRYASIIGLFVSKEMSGTFNNVSRMAAQLQQEGYPITIIDSKTNSVAEGLLVRKAAELVEKGLSYEAIVETLEEIKKDTHIYVIVKDLSYMLRGGRVSKTKGFILSKIKLKPVISIDEQGKGSIFQKTKTEAKALEKIMEKVKKDHQSRGIEAYALVYADRIEEVRPLQEAMYALTGQEPAYIEQISPIVGLNAGRGAVAVGYIKGGQSSCIQ